MGGSEPGITYIWVLKPINFANIILAVAFCVAISSGASVSAMIVVVDSITLLVKVVATNSSVLFELFVSIITAVYMSAAVAIVSFTGFTTVPRSQIISIMLGVSVMKVSEKFVEVNGGKVSPVSRSSIGSCTFSKVCIPVKK